MGVTIHYRGKLDEPMTRQSFIEELTDIAKSRKWESVTIVNDEENPELEGIVIHPGDDCESLTFLFDGEGRLRNIADLITGQTVPDLRSSYDIFVKTQYAEVEVHLWICGLLKYIKKKYISNLEVTDEGGFWEPGDAGQLVEKRKFLNDKMSQLSDCLSGSSCKTSSSLDELIEIIEEAFRRLDDSSE